MKRIEYVIDKSDPMKVLLGHPFILQSVEKLQGRNFIPTWDSMVLKMPDEGIIVPWHRDAEVPEGADPAKPIFNVDFYLDDADLRSCLWVIPGSNRWSRSKPLSAANGKASTRRTRFPFRCRRAMLFSTTLRSFTGLRAEMAMP
ncbi:phytanoyl-CoA dioxygenase family protein [Paenibacillus sp. CC-CFT747]|nr:phytanoyl-CoA dioxygenase family protein [Paenibacillus sp. CC-CFT747]